MTRERPPISHERPPTSHERPPTSHERRSGRPWEASYRDGPAPWDIGAPQSAFVELIEHGAFAGAVLDAGCGSGEHALALAARGLPVLGVDVAPTAIRMAERKAAERGLDAEFRVADALDLGALQRRFDAVLDCGLFHTFEDPDERRRYVASLGAVTGPGTTLHLLCFSDAGRGPHGPHPVSGAVLRAAFAPEAGWSVAQLEPSWVHTRLADDPFSAWLARIERV